MGAVSGLRRIPGARDLGFSEEFRRSGLAPTSSYVRLELYEATRGETEPANLAAVSE